MNTLVDASTIIATTAGLWALSFAWLTYVMSVRQHSQDEFVAIKSIVQGLGIELELMKDWTGAGGPGFSKKMTPSDAPPEWSQPGRLIWKFDCEAVSTLSSSGYVYRLGDLVAAFVRLNFSISRLFQLYDEYRTFVNNNPTLHGVLLSGQVGSSGAKANSAFQNVILNFNFDMHVKLIGGEDSDDPMCLYKTYHAATSALRGFDTNLKEKAPPWTFWVGHMICAGCFGSGIFLLFRLCRP
jgi:hypothetical protein